MLSLMILVGLGLWVLVVIGAAYLGRKLGLKYYKTARAGNLGAFLGFMLTMGGFIVYWTVEYYQIQARVSYLCKTEGGLKVFVTPEEWREEIGEEEWGNLPEDWKNIHEDIEFTFKGKAYYGSTQLNRRIISYEAKDERTDRIADSDELFVDKLTNKVLFREHYFSVGVPSIANSLEGLKFWLNDVNDCYIGEWSYKDRFFHRKYTNYQILKGK